MTSCTCPRCGNRHRGVDDELDAQIAARVLTWESECTANGWPVRSGRVSEAVAAALLGMGHKTLSNKRKSGAGPQFTHMPVSGSIYSYDLSELGAWEVMQQSGESWKV